MPLPKKGLLTQGEVVNADVGVTKKDLLRAVRTGAIARVVFSGRQRGKYKREDIVRVFQIGEVDR